MARQENTAPLSFLPSAVLAGMEARASQVPGKRSTTELRPGPLLFVKAQLFWYYHFSAHLLVCIGEVSCSP